MHRNAPESGLRAWLRSHVGLRIAELVDREGATTMVRLQLLGAPQLHAADGSMRALERREAALLALLAIEGPLPRSRAAALLWSDADSEHARSSLRQRLFKLRRSAGIDVVVPDDVLRLADGVAHDLVPIAPRLAEDPAAGAAELLGELDYSDCPGLDEWVAVAREQWRSRRIQALAEIAARLETEQKVAAALPYAERLVADDPTLEHGHRRLMRLHYLRGDRAAALAVYARCRELLRLHAGAAPGRETVELARLIEGSGQLPQARRAPVPLTMLRPPRLIGRDATWAQIEEALAQRPAILVLGEPGIGKSRLIGDMAAHLGAVLVGARPGDAQVPYALLSRLLRALLDTLGGTPVDAQVRAECARLLPELGDAAAGSLVPSRLVQALQRLIRGAGAKTIALDDLHFADDATLDILPGLASEPKTGGGWLLAVRSGEVPDALNAWRRALDTDRLLELQLGPLDVSEVRALLESLDIDGLDAEALVEPLARHTGGNPLFILETLRARIERGDARHGTALPLPDNVGQLIERRLQRLSASALKLARIAAIAGLDFSPDLAAHVMGQSPLDLVDAWGELERAQVIRDSAFSHDLVQAAVRRTVPSAIAAVLHRQVAAFLQPRDAEPARVAAHWEAAGEAALAGQAYLTAARAARRLAQHKLECQWLAAAVQNFDQAGDTTRRFDALFDLVAASRIVDPHRLAREHAERLLAAAQSDVQRAMAYESLAVVLNDAFDFAPALEAIDRLRALPPGAVLPERQIPTARTEAAALCQLGRQPEACERLRPFVGDAMEHPDQAPHAALLCDYALALISSDRPREAFDAVRRARDGAEASGDIATLYISYTFLAWAQMCLGRLRESTACYERAQKCYARIGNDRPPQDKSQVALARQYRDLGRFREALALIEAAVEQQRNGSNPGVLTISLCELATLYLVLGQTARAKQVLVPPQGALAGSIHGAHLITLARIAAAERRPTRELLEQALAHVRTEGRMAYVLRVQLDLCAALDAPESSALALEVMHRAQQLDQEWIAMPARAMAASALARCGQTARAVPMMRELIARFDEIEPVTLYAPLYWWMAYELFAAAGHVDEARAALARGRAWILDIALPNVSPEFHHSFLNRNPVNRDLLAAAGRLLA